jgi:LL-diaminopimelate aminotransferase
MQAQGADVIRLDIGSPDMPPPDLVIEALARSAHHPDHHSYSGYRGTANFREAVACYYEQRFGVVVNPETEVLPLLGSKEGIVNLCLAYLDKGDTALVPDIGYPSYSQGARLAGGEVCWIPIREENGFLPDLDTVEAGIADHAKLIWVNYPNNPTGTTVDINFYARLVEYCRAHDLLLASDNPYVDVTFDGYVGLSALQVPDAKSYAVEFLSLSKTYNMGGWRLGAAVGSAQALENLLRVKSNVDSGHFRPIYDAGSAALLHTPRMWIDERNLVYQARRDRVLEVLPDIGLRAHKTKGSLYLWAKVERGDGRTYVQEALNSAHVSFAPGSEYGPGGEQYIRISLSVPDDRLELALSRLKAWYAGYA